MLIARVSSWIRQRLGRVEIKEPVAVEAPVSKRAQPVAEKPQSAVAILRNEPNLSAAELAERAGVSLSYARSLIRRQQAKSFTSTAPTLQGQVRELMRRADPPEARILPSSDLSRRAQVLDRGAAGVAPTAIAEELTMPQGEVEFILKVERIKKSLKN